jgi:hypothetical protein
MAMTGEDYVPINVDVLRTTSRAVHVRCSDGVPRWLPRSCIFGPHEREIGNQLCQLRMIKVFRWLAEKNSIPIARK